MKNQKYLMNFCALVTLIVTPAVCVFAQTPTPQPAVTPVPAKVIEDPKAPAGWRRYQFGEVPNFSVILPAQPEATAERAPGIAAVSLYISTSANAVYAASRLEGLGVNMDSATEEVRASFFKSYVEGFGKGFQSSMNKNNIRDELKMLPPTKVRAANREAYQQDFTVGPVTGRAQLTFAGSAAFCIITVWSERTPAADREAFLGSFQLTGTPK